jgi:DNA polymerase
LQELGGPDLFLDSMPRAEAVRLMRSAAAGLVRARADDTPQLTARAPSHRVAGSERGATLHVLAEKAEGCTLCRLHASRQRVVFGEGNPEAELVVVGEAPGQDEDRSGRPFVGRAGKLLDLLLMSVGFPRAQVYICNVLKCRPPENRNPLPDEVELCTRNFLHPQLEVIAPRVLLAVGKFAAQALLSSDEAISRLRGRLHEYRGTPLVVSYHPAFLLRSPNMVRAAWSDFQLVRRVLDEQA